MKKSFIVALALLPLCLLADTSTPKGFTDNLTDALNRAKASGKLVYACFSGSDWCGWCKKLEKDVFSDENFAASVADDFELVYIDMPRNKDLLSETAKKENPVLVKKYQVSGFPTMIIFDPKDGSEVMRGGAYMGKKAAEYAEELKRIRANASQIKIAKGYEKTWLQPLKDRYMGLFSEMNDACGKFINEQLAKPENKGKKREDFRVASLEVVKGYMPKFAELQKDTEKKAAEAPAEIKPMIEAYAADLKQWIEKHSK